MEKTIPCNGFKYDLLWEVGLNDAKENGVWVMGEEADRLWIRYCCWCDQRRQLSENANSTSWSNQKSPFRITEAELKGAESWAWNIPAGKETEKLTGLRGLDQISHQETEGAWIFLGCGWRSLWDGVKPGEKEQLCTASSTASPSSHPVRPQGTKLMVRWLVVGVKNYLITDHAQRYPMLCLEQEERRTMSPKHAHERQHPSPCSGLVHVVPVGDKPDY